jgi:plasmid maintenance system antidote protein VapI
MKKIIKIKKISAEMALRVRDRLSLTRDVRLNLTKHNKIEFYMVDHIELKRTLIGERILVW